MLDEFRDAAGEAEFGALFRALVGQGDLQAFVEECVFPEPRRERVVAEDGLFKNAGVWMKRDSCAGFARSAGLLELRGRFALLIGLLPHGAVPLNLELKPVGERVDDGNADAVQTPGNFVRIAVELSASVKNREHNLGCWTFLRRMHVHGYAA